MPFRESKIERKETPKDKEAEDIEAMKKKLEEKYPEYVKFVEAKMNVLREYAEKRKKKYPELKDLNNYARKAGFKEVLINPEEERGGIGVDPLFNLILIKESYLPTIKILKAFAPDFLEKAIKYTLGNIKEKIPGHEQEHLKDLSLKIYPKEIETVMKHREARLGGRIEEAIRLEEELKKLKNKGDFYAELQRIQKQPILEHPEIKEWAFDECIKRSRIRSFRKRDRYRQERAFKTSQ